MAPAPVVACGLWEGRAPSCIPKPCPVVLVGCRVLDKISFILCPILANSAQPHLHRSPPDCLPRTCPLLSHLRCSCWGLEWKAALRALCFPWLFLWKSWEWWLVDQWEYGDFHWPLSLALLGKPAKENLHLSFCYVWFPDPCFTGGEGTCACERGKTRGFLQN